MAFKIDIHNHILPERWPDLKEVSTNFAANFRDTLKLFSEIGWRQRTGAKERSHLQNMECFCSEQPCFLEGVSKYWLDRPKVFKGKVE